MSDDRQPGYDFYTPPRPAPGPEPAAPPNAAAGGQSFNPYGAQGPLRNVVPQQTAPLQMPWAAHLQPVRRSGMPRWLIAFIVIIGMFFCLGILAAVAIPVFLSQQMKADFRATTVSLPATFNGAQQNTGPEAMKVAKGFVIDGIGAEDVAVYGDVGPEMIVIVALKPEAAMSTSRQTAERRDLERGFADQGTSLVMVGGEAGGDLPGWIGCGSTEQGVEICLATSVGSLVAVVTSVDTGDPATLIRQAQAATVHRS